MPDQAKTSFIPKQSGGASPRSRRVAHLSIVNFVGMVVFLCGLILAVGVFIYKDLSQQELNEKKRLLADEKSAFSTGDIENLRALDRRISVAGALLEAHLSPSVVFDMLEARTLTGVSYTLFSYKRRPSGSAEVVLDGITPRFNTLALQERELGRASTFEGVTLSGLTLSEERLVSFVVVGDADEATLAFTAPSTEPAATSAATSTAAADDEATPPAGSEGDEEGEGEAAELPIGPEVDE